MMSFSMKAPIFCWRPERDSGIPIFLDILACAAEMPSNRLKENPPLFILHASFSVVCRQ